MSRKRKIVLVLAITGFSFSAVAGGRLVGLTGPVRFQPDIPLDPVACALDRHFHFPSLDQPSKRNAAMIPSILEVCGAVP